MASFKCHNFQGIASFRWLKSAPMIFGSISFKTINITEKKYRSFWKKFLSCLFCPFNKAHAKISDRSGSACCIHWQCFSNEILLRLRSLLLKGQPFFQEGLFVVTFYVSLLGGKGHYFQEYSLHLSKKFYHYLWGVSALWESVVIFRTFWAFTVVLRSM